MKTTLIEKPLLEINVTEDGVWLMFKDRYGRHGAINLPVVFDGSKISDNVIWEWCKQYANLNPPKLEAGVAEVLAMGEKREKKIKNEWEMCMEELTQQEKLKNHEQKTKTD